MHSDIQNWESALENDLKFRFQKCGVPVVDQYFGGIIEQLH